MKTELTIEESARLIELGVDPKLASKTIVTDEYNEQWENFQHPIFGFSDILSILPKEIGNYSLNITYSEGEYFVSYILWDTDEDYGDYIRDTYDSNQFSAPELIDALNSLLIWAIENNHVNLNSDKK